MIEKKILDIDQINVSKTKEELIEIGRKKYQAVPSEKLTAYQDVKRNAVNIIKSVEKNLISELLPLRRERMLKNSFSFYRGTAGLMDFDLAAQIHSNIPVLLCGDAHIGNYGFYASPERQLLFDLNDFDEARIGNWESDLRRLLVSVYLAGRDNGFKDKKLRKLLGKVTAAYRAAIAQAGSMNLMERFHLSPKVRLLAETVREQTDGDFEKPLADIIGKATKNDLGKVLKKFTMLNSNGERVFIEDTPRSVHVSKKQMQKFTVAFKDYRTTVPERIKVLLMQYRITDVIRHSVGVGSFGTRCYLLLLTANDSSHLVLQVKEALPTRDSFIPLKLDIDLHREIGEGNRIIKAQKIMQSASDPFLGSMNVGQRSYYVRQFRDMKGSFDLEKMGWQGYKLYTEVCALLLAFSHFHSPTAPIIQGYLEEAGDDFDELMAAWTVKYAQQVSDDYKKYKKYVVEN
ncbi:hypothetical protein JCM15457_1842 [Liquorilactobacillus sucicola DSM 21376 = JCM 15457]|uniref:DUF2252 domain-containing protein n=1 Tax=Liquorilactobacillus sucicola DSM 21376 = JCM 15457 TaxID=1423806 RepID=A0A023CZF1_9LACO|nr:DUF2252 domain-containing protein [Liquorilactobacillus sucicola]KRN07483.1 hypothetical protein FD15_GL000763 [Liquorilactobacillus sucicola DSM 21376 = JCM 15457]GAJ26890.1 hypothetical protein JCM15457_1842 [Liquorilactobacillus sucicola DSM 21376 = JCM 15457]